MALDWVGIAAAIGAGTGLASVAKDFLLPKLTAKQEHHSKVREDILQLLFQFVERSLRLPDILRRKSAADRTNNTPQWLSIVDEIDSIEGSLALLAVHCKARNIDVTGLKDSFELFKRQCSNYWERAYDPSTEDRDELLNLALYEQEALLEFQDAAAQLAADVTRKFD